MAWATGRHARRGGHGQLLSCSAWIPPVPCHHENERKKEGWRERGSEQVSRCDLCWHCMSMLMKKKGGGGRDTHLACSCCCLLVACQPLRCSVLVCHTHMPLLLLILNTTTVHYHAHGACACMFVSVPSVQHTHDMRRKEWFACVVVLCFCDWFSAPNPLTHTLMRACAVCGGDPW